MQVILRQFNGTIIRRCDSTDLISVMEINMKTLPEHYSDYFYESILADMPESFLIAENAGAHIGYIMCKSEFGFSNFKKLGFVKKDVLSLLQFLMNYVEMELAVHLLKKHSKVLKKDSVMKCILKLGVVILMQ